MLSANLRYRLEIIRVDCKYSDLPSLLFAFKDTKNPVATHLADCRAIIRMLSKYNTYKLINSQVESLNLTITSTFCGKTTLTMDPPYPQFG